MRTCWVYILASRSRALYVGMTCNVARRLEQHRELRPGTHSARYLCTRLVYAEAFDGPMAAIRREKQLKSWSRAKKLALVEADNPTWRDLTERAFAGPTYG